MECLVELDCDENSLFTILNDYENLPSYLPRQLKSVKILDENSDHSIIEIIIFFKTLIKKEFSQKIKIKNNIQKELSLEVLDGHAKNTKITISLTKKDGKNLVSIECNLKLSLKTAILHPIAKREYNSLVTGVFKKITSDAKKTEETC